MADREHRETDEAAATTDKELTALERRVRMVYTQAQKDLQDKMDAFVSGFARRDAAQREKLAKGEITDTDYQRWLSGQVFQGKRWKAKVDQMADSACRYDQIAQSITNGFMDGVFANNANWQSYSLEHGAGLNFGFEIYDRDAVARLLRDEPSLLPKKRVNVPKDRAWNAKKITQQVTLGILQGERLDQVAKRVRNVAEMDRNTALTNARTAMTGAQNAGRQESLNRATTMGLKVKKGWLATLDSHTRHQHAFLDGQRVDTDKPFHYQGFRIMYPGDPHAHPSMVYGCRCTMVGDLVEYPDEDAQRYDNIAGKPIKDMTFKEWLKAKKKKPSPKPSPKPITLKGVRSALGDEYADAMDVLLNFTEETDVRDLFYKYGDRIRVMDSKLASGAYFSSADGGIHINAKAVMNGDTCHTPYQTAFHEFSHNIDWLIGGDNYGVWISREYENGLLQNTIKSDYRKFAASVLRNNPRYIYDDTITFSMLLDEMAKSTSDPKYSELSQSLDRFWEVDPKDIYYNNRPAIDKYLDSADEAVMSKYGRWVAVVLKEEKRPTSETGSVSDMLEYCTGIDHPLGVGHGTKYWKQGGYDSGNGPIEFFAEVCDGKAANPKSLEQMRRVFPNAVKVVEEIIKEATK